jgi:hypothetical protein
VKPSVAVGVLETVRVATGIALYLALNKWAATLTQTLGTNASFIPPLMTVLEVIISALVVVFVSGYVLGRPTVSLLWRTEANGLPQSGRVNLPAQGQSVHLQIELHGDTLLRRTLSLICKRYPLELTLEVSPADSLAMRIEYQLPLTGVIVANSKIIFQSVDLRPGMNRTLQLTIRRSDGSSFPIPVSVGVSSRFAGARMLGWVGLVRFESGISGFNLGGA